MCGLVGVVDVRGVSSAVLHEMTCALSHRGPNDSGLLCFDPDAREFIEPDPEITHQRRYPLAIGFRRLSILDTSNHGHQPMVSLNGRYAIAYNGELYNFHDLRAELIARGCHFRSKTDTEVVLRLYELYGAAMLSRLNGMFALAILDRDTQMLFLARDRMGIKPLYYYVHNGCLVFASEVKAFLYYPAFELTLDYCRLSEFFLFRYIAGTHCLLRGVRSLEPGTYMMVGYGHIVNRVYWTIPQHRPELGVAEGRTQLEELIQESVTRQLISDVKIGCQLSGGIDSSLVSYWASRKHGGLFDSVSVVFEDPRHGEEPYIDRVNRSLGLVGHKATLDVKFMLKHLKQATWHYDFPLSLPNSLGIYLLSQCARKYVTVLLSGEGADEVFGGYRRCYLAAWLLRLGRIPGLVRLSGLERTLQRFESIEETLLGLSAFGEPELVQRIYPEFSLKKALASRIDIWRATQDGNFLERLLTYEQRTYLVELLLRQDKMCMAHSVENRVPMLDHRIVELAKRMPTRLKVSTPIIPRGSRSDYFTKIVLKEIVATIYDRPFAYRSKSYFALPLHDLFASPGFVAAFPEYREALSDLGACNLFEVDAVYKAARELGGSYAALLWSVVAFGAWWSVFQKPRTHAH
jgi:asparagine synthase (glutamine-hydrolysing)